MNNLEQFTYTDMSMYKSQNEDIEHFQRISALPNMAKIRLHKNFIAEGFHEFLGQNPRIILNEVHAEVTFRHNYLPYYDIYIIR